MLSTALLPLLLAVTPQHLPITAKWCLPQGCIGLEVPQTPQQYQTGLMQRPPLGPWRGMWFRFQPKQRVHFWMKDCIAPLDLVYVRDGRVQQIKANVPPCNAMPCPKYSSDAPVDGVIELQAGRAAELGLKPGSPAAPTPGSTGLGAFR
ncbi:MAG: DUF192 domain-containing protein [Synechococcus sp.]|nr:DUF192 domain-containing protein [Synechococcus sp.]